MRFRTTIILLAVLAAVIAYVAFYEPKILSTEEAREKKKEVFDFRSEDVTSLSILTGSSEITMRRVGDRQWILESPVEWQADSSTIGSILSDLEFLQCESRMAPPAGKSIDLVSFGLDSPEMSISFTEKGTGHKITLGSRKGIDGKLYARVDDTNEVLILSPIVLSKAKVPPIDFRDKTVLEFETDKVKGLKVDRKDGRLKCELEGEQWFIVEPARFRASEIEVESLVNQLAALKVKEWIDDSPTDLAKYGLDSPVVAAKLNAGTEEQPTLFLGTTLPDKSDQRYATTTASPLVFAVRESIAPALEKPHPDLRDRTLVHIKPEQIMRLSIASDSSLLALANRGSVASENWDINLPLDIDADDEEVVDYLEELGRVEIKEFVSDSLDSLSQYGLEKPKATISFEVTKAEEKTERKDIYFGDLGAGGELIYAKRSDEPSVYAVAADELPRLFTSYLAFRHKRVLDFRTADVEKATLHRDGKAFVCEAEGVSKWRLLEPFEVSADSVAVRAMLNILSSLKAERFISDSSLDWASYGLTKPALRIVLKLKQKEGEEKAPLPVDLSIGGKSDAELYYAKLANNNLLFLVSQKIVDQLRKHIIDRTVTDFLTSEVRNVHISYPKEDVEIVLKQKNDKWEMTEPEKAGVDKSRLSPVLLKLRRLSCKAFVEELEDKPADLGLDNPAYVVEVGLESKTITLTLGAQTPDGDYYGSVSTAALPFILDKSDARVLMVKAADLRKEGS